MTLVLCGRRNNSLFSMGFTPSLQKGKVAENVTIESRFASCITPNVPRGTF